MNEEKLQETARDFCIEIQGSSYTTEAKIIQAYIAGYKSRESSGDRSCHIKSLKAALNNVLELAIANESIVLNGIVHQQALRALEIND